MEIEELLVAGLDKEHLLRDITPIKRQNNVAVEVKCHTIELKQLISCRSTEN